jgi:hypothetical protein
MRGIVLGVSIIVGSALVTANVLPFLLVVYPAARDDARIGAGAMAGIFLVSLSLCMLVLRRCRRS